MNKIIFSLFIFVLLSSFSCKKEEEPDPLVGVSLIGSFTATNYTITEGETTALIWAVLLADRIWIEPEIGDVLAVGVLDISPKVTTTYTLHASYTYVLNGKSKTKSESKSLTITVNPAPPEPIQSKMWVIPSAIKEGESATVHWLEIYDASKVHNLRLNWETYGPNKYPHCGTSGRNVTGTSYTEKFEMDCTSVNQVMSYFSLEVHFKDGSVQTLKDLNTTLIINR